MALNWRAFEVVSSEFKGYKLLLWVVPELGLFGINTNKIEIVLVVGSKDIRKDVFGVAILPICDKCDDLF